MSESNTAIVDIVRRQLERDLVTCQNPNVILLHFAAGVSNELVTVIKGYPVSGIRQDFHDHALHFNKFFFSQNVLQVISTMKNNPKAFQLLSGLENSEGD